MAICRASGELVCVYAVGNVEVFPSGVDPNTLYVGTTWVRLKGKVVVGVDESQSEFNTVNKSGGAKTVQLSIDEIPAHSHSANSNVTGSHTHADNWRSLGTPPGGYHKELNGLAPGNSFGDVGVGRTNNATIPAAGNHSHTITIGNTGGGWAHNNLQPYITKFLWERTS